ncbi:MAG: type II secretion system F family protein [Proteobacteria bacterium]|nr:type II secretion system F family protein [Pseudomonadota bacterium]NOG59740.1 type II secretion system F family protein [Pseudomonadota bacterium]
MNAIINDHSILFDGAVGSTGLAVFFFILTVYFLNSLVQEEDRTYMDPLPLSLRLIWPFIQIISYFFSSRLPYELMEKIEKKLQHTGVSYLLNADQFVALRIISTIGGTLFGLILVNALKGGQPIWVLFAMIVGFVLPDIWLSDNRKRRETAVMKAMPVYLDFITMAVEAGLNLQGALGQAMEKAPKSPLRNEFGIVLRDLRAGLPRSEALRRMADRLDIKEVTSFVSAMIQAEKMGSSMAAVLRVQADQRRNERFQRAEKQAMEAPIKLVGPLIIFIFPVTFIVLGFPIVMKFTSQGML